MYQPCTNLAYKALMENHSSDCIILEFIEQIKR